MVRHVVGIITALKLLLTSAKHSTDFEVHRNWLAITYSLPISQWYYDTSSQWTLDYPPFFAYFEFLLAQIAKFVDPLMLKLDNLNYASEKAIYFQRFSVIVVDTILIFGANFCIKSLGLKDAEKKNITICLILGNVGLLLIDHIHFQYNGFLFGILLFSIGHMVKRNYLLSALLYCILLNFKHIFLYIAPVYVAFLLKFYCLRSKKPVRNFFKLLLIILSCLIVSFGPFIYHMPQVLSRLFPFKRGLTHAYWAPNFWALYNFIDKIGSTCLKIEGATNTRGLVQEYKHVVLPSVTPMCTFILIAIFILPCIVKLLMSIEKNEHLDFIRAIVICSCTSFLFGWHVHEKAILITIIPLSLLVAVDKYDGKMFHILGIIGHYSLFPLFLKPKLIVLVKYFLYFSYSVLSKMSLDYMYHQFKVELHEKLYFIVLFLLFFYESVLQHALNLDDKFPFLPLMLTSVFCSLGIIYFYCKYYYRFLSMGYEQCKRGKKYN